MNHQEDRKQKHTQDNKAFFKEIGNFEWKSHIYFVKINEIAITSVAVPCKLTEKKCRTASVTSWIREIIWLVTHFIKGKYEIAHWSSVNDLCSDTNFLDGHTNHIILILVGISTYLPSEITLPTYPWEWYVPKL